MIILSESQIQRQDIVDNAIFRLVQDINPSPQVIDWDIEMIGNIRDEIEYWLVERLKVCKPEEFYFFQEESK
jgi:hypothetical protein